MLPCPSCRHFIRVVSPEMKCPFCSEDVTLVREMSRPIVRLATATSLSVLLGSGCCLVSADEMDDIRFEEPEPLPENVYGPPRDMIDTDETPEEEPPEDLGTRGEEEPPRRPVKNVYGPPPGKRKGSGTNKKEKK